MNTASPSADVDASGARNAAEDSPIFSTQPVATEYSPPVIVVGLPRSGSSFLSHVMSQIEDWYVFDDLYVYRFARGIGADDGPLSQEQLKKIVFMLGWQVRARIKFPKFHIPEMTLEDVDRMDEALLATYAERPVTWNELQQEWLVRLARHHGCQRWGYKAPQDFMNLEMLNRVYPDLKVVFLYRDPRKVMASFKHIAVDNKDGHPGQYHPIVYAQYWKMALSTLKRVKEAFPDRVCEVKFEDLSADPQGEGERIAGFLGTRVNGEIEVKKPNSSFKEGAARRPGITPTETWICERIAGELMREKGYDESGDKARFRVRDLPDFIYITLRFGLYQIRRVIEKPGALVSIKSYISSMFSRSKPAI